MKWNKMEFEIFLKLNFYVRHIFFFFVWGHFCFSTYILPKETIAAITILYRNTKVKVCSLDGDTEYFNNYKGTC